jgi:hypothetical protein
MGTIRTTDNAVAKRDGLAPSRCPCRQMNLAMVVPSDFNNPLEAFIVVMDRFRQPLKQVCLVLVDAG